MRGLGEGRIGSRPFAAVRSANQMLLARAVHTSVARARLRLGRDDSQEHLVVRSPIALGRVAAASCERLGHYRTNHHGSPTKRTRSCGSTGCSAMKALPAAEGDRGALQGRTPMFLGAGVGAA